MARMCGNNRNYLDVSRGRRGDDDDEAIGNHRTGLTALDAVADGGGGGTCDGGVYGEICFFVVH